MTEEQKTLVLFLVVFILWLIFLPISALIFKLSWNYVMPSIFQLPMISFWHSFAILLLKGILFPSINLKK